jgi:hypothetical protein
MNTESAGPDSAPADKSCGNPEVSTPLVAQLDGARDSIPHSHFPPVRSPRCSKCKLHSAVCFKNRFSPRPLHFEDAPCQAAPVP